jgi:hypothetical protein
MEIISTNNNYPKTVVIRNSKGGMIWQIYHVHSYRAAEIIAKRAHDNAFDGVTLEDYQPNMEETSPNWQNDFSTDVELRLLEGTNKIQYLLNKGLINLDDIKEYTKKWMDAVDAYDDEAIDRYYAEQYNQEQYEEDEERKLRDEMMLLEDLYGQDDELQDQMLRDEMEGIENSLRDDEEDYEPTFPTQSLHPKYVIASTSMKLEETMVFECDEDGNRLSLEDYGCIAKRLGHIKMWQNRDVAVKFCLREHEYTWRKEFKEVDGCIQTLYERFDPEHFHEKTPEQRAAMVAIKYENFVVC